MPPSGDDGDGGLGDGGISVGAGDGGISVGDDGTAGDDDVAEAISPRWFIGTAGDDGDGAKYAERAQPARRAPHNHQAI